MLIVDSERRESHFGRRLISCDIEISIHKLVASYFRGGWLAGKNSRSPGYLIFGPYWPIDRGIYQIVVSIIAQFLTVLYSRENPLAVMMARGDESRTVEHRCTFSGWGTCLDAPRPGVFTTVRC
jgi:hypothetical protein